MPTTSRGSGGVRIEVAPAKARERNALEVLHRDEVAAVDLAELEHLADVRMRDLRGDPRLVEEHRDELLDPSRGAAGSA